MLFPIFSVRQASTLQQAMKWFISFLPSSVRFGIYVCEGKTPGGNDVPGLCFFSLQCFRLFSILLFIFLTVLGLFLAFFLLVDMPCVFNSIYATIDQAVHTTIAQRSDCEG